MRIDFANNTFVPGIQRTPEKGMIKATGMTATTRGGGDHDPVDVHESHMARAEPQEVWAVVIGVLIEGQKESVSVADLQRQERLAHQVK